MQLKQSIPLEDAQRAFEGVRNGRTNLAFDDHGLPIGAVRTAVGQVMHAQYLPHRTSVTPQRDEHGEILRLNGPEGTMEVYAGVAADISEQLIERSARQQAVQGGKVRVNNAGLEQ